MARFFFSVRYMLQVVIWHIVTSYTYLVLAVLYFYSVWLVHFIYFYLFISGIICEEVAFF